jgi:hypothetical protein
LTAKCRGNVHDKGVVEITASSVYSNFTPRNVADLGINWDLLSQNKPSQQICWDFKVFRIEPKHHTIRKHKYGSNDENLKS